MSRLKQMSAGGLRFFREVFQELKKVHWPTRRETAIFTAVVVGSVLFVAAIIWAFDGLLGLLLQGVL